MKLTLVLLTAAIVNVSAKGLSQTISFNAKNASLQEVFSVIEKQTGFTVVYNTTLLDKAKPVSLAVTDVPLRDFLQQALKGQQLEFSIKNTTIFISSSPSRSSSHVDNNFLPPGSIKVRVTNADGQPLEGASISIKNNKNVGLTSAEGVLSLNVTEGDVIVISYVGYQTKEVKITSSLASSGLLVVSLIQDVESLNEVVINKGYYTETMRNTVGNVARVTAKDIEKAPVNNPLLAIQGRVPGIEITQLSGLNGGGVQVRIQGRNSIRQGLDPLIIIDGVPYLNQLPGSGVNLDELILKGNNGLSFINPSDIEAIDILKDAEATSIYGSRAANGAILITTKRGKAGKTKIALNIQQGWSKVAKHVDMLTTRQYLDMRYEAYRNANIDWRQPSVVADDLKLWDTTRYTDWQKVLIGNDAKYSNINIGMSGGTSAIQYMIGGTFNRNTTVFPGNFNNKNGSAHVNINTSTDNRKLRLQLTANYTHSDNALPASELTESAIKLAPNAPPLYNSDKSVNWAPNSSGLSTWVNPLSRSESTEFSNIGRNLLSSLIARYTPVTNVEISCNIGYNQLTTEGYMGQRLEYNRPELRPIAQRVAAFTSRNMNTWLIEPQAHYSKGIAEGKIDVLLGGTIQKQDFQYLSINSSGYPTDQLMKNLIAATNIEISGSNSGVMRYSAAFGRVNYVLKEKYILNGTVRRDGSNRFGDNNKFNNFWSAGLGWIFSEEHIIKKLFPFLNFGKLRMGYGTTGNDQIPDFSYVSIYELLSLGIQYQGATSLWTRIIPNPNLQWEQTRKWQTGIDIGIIKDRVFINLTYTKNLSTNQLITYPLPSLAGSDFVIKNLPAKIENRGWEISTIANILKMSNFSWSTNVNLTIPRNKLVNFPGIENTSYASGLNGIVVGQPLGVVKVTRFAGINPLDGLSYEFDLNGNLKSGGGDRIKFVSLDPKYYGGVTNSFQFKRLTFEFLFQFSKRMGSKDIFFNNGSLYPGVAGLSSVGGFGNQPIGVTQRWQKPGDQTLIPRYYTAGYRVGANPPTDINFNYDRSFIKLRNVSLTWELQRLWIQRIKMQNGRLFFRGQNLIVISKYKGLDPETGNSTLPPLQTWTVGGNFEF